MNLSLIKSLTLSSFLISLAAADQAPKIKSNPKNILAIADFPEGFSKKVLGNVVFSAKNGGKVKVHVDMTGLPKEGGPFYYHIHENLVPENGNCDAVGLHFNPYHAPPDCESQKDDSYCQVGDLSGKHGWIDTTCFETKYDDPFLSLNKKSKSYIVGKSVTFHFANLTKFACATIQLASKARMSSLQNELGDSVYAEMLDGSELVNYSFNEQEAVDAEVFEMAHENNEDGYDYKSSANSVRSITLDERSYNSTNSSGLYSQRNLTNSSSIEHLGLTCENNAEGLSINFVTPAIGALLGFLM